MMAPLFGNREDAGRRLAQKALGYAHRPDVVVLALPRGGVPVGYEVATALDAPLDVYLVRKLGTPRHEELAMGAIASGGVRLLNYEVIDVLQIPEATIEAVTSREMVELDRRERAYHRDRPPLEVQGRVVILVDDGLATGSTMRAAVAALRSRRPARIIVAVPVSARVTCEALRSEVDEVICLATTRTVLRNRSLVWRFLADFGYGSDRSAEPCLSCKRGRATPGPLGY